MQRNSVDAFELIRQLEILESSDGVVELSPIWTVAKSGSSIVCLEARGPQQVIDDPVHAEIIQTVLRGPIAASALVVSVADALQESATKVFKSLRELLAARLLRAILGPGSPAVALDSIDLDRFRHQIAYFQAHERPGLSAAAMQTRLLNARVTVLGVGGLGSSVAHLLLAAGVRNLRLVDGDFVERSNLPRQLFFAEADIGMLKVEALGKKLRARDAAARLELIPRFVSSQEDALEFVYGSDFVVLCADAPAVRLNGWVGEACIRNAVPYLAMAGAWVGPLYVPTRSPCYLCQSRFNSRELPDVRLHLSAFLDAPHERVRPAFPPGPSLTAALICAAAVEFLSGADVYRLASRRFFVDLHGNHAEVEMPRYLDCTRCGSPQ